MLSIWLVKLYVYEISFSESITRNNFQISSINMESYLVNSKFKVSSSSYYVTVLTNHLNTFRVL